LVPGRHYRRSEPWNARRLRRREIRKSAAGSVQLVGMLSSGMQKRDALLQDYPSYRARARALSSPAGSTGSVEYMAYGQYGESPPSASLSYTAYASDSSHTPHALRGRPLMAALTLGLALATAALAGESRTERMIGPSVRHLSIYRPEGPFSIQVVEADTSDPCI